MLRSRKLTIALFAFYLLALSALILFKTRMSFRFLHLMFNFADPNVRTSVNLVPFGGMLVLNGRPDYNEIILNGLVFVPFGVFLSMLGKKKSFASLFLPIFLTSLLFEVAQYVFSLGASDITDVLANTLGGLLGVGIFYVLRKLCKEKVYGICNAAALAFTIGFVFLLSFVRPL